MIVQMLMDSGAVMMGSEVMGERLAERSVGVSDRFVVSLYIHTH